MSGTVLDAWDVAAKLTKSLFFLGAQTRKHGSDEMKERVTPRFFGLGNQNALVYDGKTGEGGGGGTGAGGWFEKY